MSTAFGPQPSQEIVPLQLAFVAMLRDQLLDEEARRIATDRLLALARATPWPGLACRALEHVLGCEIETTFADDPGFGDPVNARLHEMIRRGEGTCTRCLRPLPDERTLEVWRLRFEAAAWDRNLRAVAQ